MPYNTGNPIGSSDARDLYDNAAALDRAMNSGDPTWTDRLGNVRPTFAGAESVLNLKVEEAAAAADSMDDRWLGAKSADPATDNDGDPLQIGAGYYNTTQSAVRVYGNSGWYTPNVDGQALGQNGPGQGSEMVRTPDGGTLADSLKSKLGQVVDTMADLNALDTTKYTRAFALGYYAAGDGGGGAYYYDEGGSLWKLVFARNLSVEQFGAKGDGVTDDSAAIAAADADLAKGGKLEFGRNKTYLCNATVALKNAGTIDLNGSTIKAGAAITAQVFSWQDLIDSYVAGVDYTAFSVTANKSKFAIPVGVSLSVGNVVKLMSNTARLTGYNHGVMATVVNVFAGVAYVNCPFYETFQVDSIEVYEGFELMEIGNGAFDLTGIGNTVAFTEALLIRGSNARVKGVNFFGSEYAGVGVRVDCDGATIENCLAVGFLNTQGIPGGGRVGYGFAAYGNNTVIDNCVAWNCKHDFAAGSREKVSRNVTYRDCKAYNDDDSASFDAAIDMHANVIGKAEILDCEVVSRYVLFNIRCSGLRVRGGRYIQTSGPSQAIVAFDQPITDVEISDIEYSLADANSALLNITSGTDATVTSINGMKFSKCKSLSSVGRFIQIDRATPVAGLTVERCEHAGGYLLRHAGGTIDGLVIRKNGLTVVEGAIRIVMDGAIYDAANVTIERNTIKRNVGTSNENLLFMDSTTATRIDAPHLAIRSNTFIHSGDGGTGYSISLSQIAATFFDLSGNRSNRGSFRCISLDGVSIIRGIINGQIIDGSFVVNNTADATVLTDVSVHGNAGDAFTVSVAGSGVTKTRYVDADNNFVTYTP